VGLHAYAETIAADGSGWATAPRLVGNASEPSAYSSRVQFSDGTEFSFFRRERPELRTNAAGDPTHLITGIEYFADHPGAVDNHQYLPSPPNICPHLDSRYSDRTGMYHTIAQTHVMLLVLILISIWRRAGTHSRSCKRSTSAADLFLRRTTVRPPPRCKIGRQELSGLGGQQI
jgi:hypothetical protein